jgi:hypothetical protein
MEGMVYPLRGCVHVAGERLNDKKEGGGERREGGSEGGKERKVSSLSP